MKLHKTFIKEFGQGGEVSCGYDLANWAVEVRINFNWPLFNVQVGPFWFAVLGSP